MSVEAVNWAFDQRGLKPATKLVLVFLGDCHNRHTRRVDPSQALLADECEMSRSTVNVHLAKLESLGLIRRIQRSDSQKKTQKRTLYILGLDMKAAPDDAEAVSENRIRENTKAVSGNRTRNYAKAVSGKRPIPCPENTRSRVRTVGHEPEGNQKGTARAKNVAVFFTEDERFEAKEIIAHLKRGGKVNPEMIEDRVWQCMESLGLMTDEEKQQFGLLPKTKKG